jgi:hypothetical protein
VRLIVSPITHFEPVNRFFHELQYGGYVIEGDLNAIIFNPVASNIPKWRTFKLLRWIQNLHQSTWDHAILFADMSSKDEQTLVQGRGVHVTGVSAAYTFKLNKNILSE